MYQQFNSAPRQMYDVSAMNLACKVCGEPIKELPFQPDPSKDVFCKIHRPRKNDNRMGGNMGGGFRN